MSRELSAHMREASPDADVTAARSVRRSTGSGRPQVAEGRHDAKAELRSRRWVEALPAIAGLVLFVAALEVLRIELRTADAVLLLRGESGTGKNVLARWIRANSPRADAPFVTVNCPALSGDLMTSALFGHRKGAFTGAVADVAGKVQEAEGGTLLLDEVGELTADAQARLLRFLHDRVLSSRSRPSSGNTSLASWRSLRRSKRRHASWTSTPQRCNGSASDMDWRNHIMIPPAETQASAVTVKSVCQGVQHDVDPERVPGRREPGEVFRVLAFPLP